MLSKLKQKNIKVLKISNVYDYKLDSKTETCIIGGINANNLSDKILNKFDLIAMSSAIRNIPDIIKINKLYKNSAMNNSKKAFVKAKNLFPGGVNSP